MNGGGRLIGVGIFAALLVRDGLRRGVIVVVGWISEGVAGNCMFAFSDRHQQCGFQYRPVIGRS